MKADSNRKIRISYTVKKLKDCTRINAMYCFKLCEKNQN